MRILFFMPLAIRTGSEVALFNLITYAARSGRWQLGVVCPQEGELLRELPEQVRVFVYKRWGALRKVYAGARRRLGGGGENQFFAAAHAEFRPDLWYVNTVVQTEVLRQAERRGVACVLHTHELEQMLDRLPERDADLLVRAPRLVVACSETARKVFRVLGREDAIEVVYETIDPARIKWSEEASREVRRGLKIGDETFVWAMTGTLDPNKNPARFAEVAAELTRGGADVHFLWVGRGGSAYATFARERARALGVADRVSFVGERTGDYYDYLNAADGLCITSYKESFSIVAAEAAHLGKPVVSFDCGGVAEIVREGMGEIVRSWNNSDLTAALARVMRGEAGFDARVGRERVREFYVETQGARWERLVSQYFEKGAAGGRAAGGATG
ncbi:MAG TPA: glycosyltransferase [Pyrinomonadaceae bacterium]|nr:glycosyltransferase [Pyrinomonadaceae bacterium]